ncbi:AraC family transcriptional regulator [Paenibacillus gansuensis]|uniref:Helix-turn-helix domain-containing protein n=1 Tax=Paenibacillus gansuensis TaxID=306542 RepID=A0ABW5PEW8_9BACL
MKAELAFFCAAKRDEQTHILLHQHACYEIVYYRDGKGTTLIGPGQHRFSPYTFAVIPPATPHEERHHAPADVWFAGFRTTNGLTFPTGFFQDTEQEQSPIYGLLERMQQEFHDKKPLYEEKLDLLCSELVIELTRVCRPSEAEEPQHTGKLQYVRNYIDENFQQKISLSELAGLAGYSYDRFRHLFKEATGLAPHQYVLNLRLCHARRMLQTTSLPVSYIAHESGFSTDAQFSHLFKRETGLTPLKYRATATT